jgi:hypothetical protein
MKKMEGDVTILAAGRGDSCNPWLDDDGDVHISLEYVIVACRVLSRQLLGKHVPTATDTHTTVEVFWKWCFLLDPGKGVILRKIEARICRLAIFRSRCQEISNEDTAGWKVLGCGLVNCESVKISDGAIIKRNYELCVKVINKFNIQSETRFQSHPLYLTVYYIGAFFAYLIKCGA